MSNNCYHTCQISGSVLSNITHFKTGFKAGANMVNRSHTVAPAHSRIHARVRIDTHTSTESVSELSIIASGSPMLFGWLQVDG